MPQLAKGGKWTYGWVVMGEDRYISVPPDACVEYGLEPGCELAFVPGSARSGGFGIATPALLQRAREKSGLELRVLARGVMETDGCVRLPELLGSEPGDRLVSVRGSCFALGFAAKGYIYETALEHSDELETFVADGQVTSTQASGDESRG